MPCVVLRLSRHYHSISARCDVVLQMLMNVSTITVTIVTMTPVLVQQQQQHWNLQWRHLTTMTTTNQLTSIFTGQVAVQLLLMNNCLNLSTFQQGYCELVSDEVCRQMWLLSHKPQQKATLSETRANFASIIYKITLFTICMVQRKTFN